MKYSFDKIIDRRLTGSCKWDSIDSKLLDEGVVPMTVADMEFEVAPQIKSAIIKAAEHSIYGYTQTDKLYVDALSNYMKRRHDFSVSSENLICTMGIVPAFGIVIRALTNEGDGIIIQPPVYSPFYNSIKINNRKVLENPLLNIDGKYQMDYDGLENLCKGGAKLLMLCSPHNPVGRVWSYDELKKVGDICTKYNVTILCDEIHNDIVYNGRKHYVLANLPGMSDRVITCTAMSKTFNLAGLMLSNIFIKNKELYKTISHQAAKDGSGCIPYFGRAAAISAFTECDEWIDELLNYLNNNINICYNFINENIRGIKCTQAEGTYLLWLDCRGLKLNDKQLEYLFYEQAKIPVNMGASFGTNGSGFVRMNVAVSKSTLNSALERLNSVINNKEVKI